MSQCELCDNMPDCPLDMSEKENCLCQVSYIQSYHCTRVKQQNGKLYCGCFYHRDKYGMCEKYISDKQTKIPSEQNLYEIMFQCNDGLHINLHMLNDLMPDCIGAEDEPELLALLTNNTQKSCNNHSQLPCMEGHSKCFEIKRICIFDLDMEGGLYPCKNGAHVENCAEVMCSKNFKCKDSYCIPWQFVCNGQWDCPWADEENVHICNKGQCIDMYLCKNKQHICVPLSSVCDANTACPFGDDEMLCDLSKVECPSHCHCLAYALYCNKVIFAFQNMVQLPFHLIVVCQGLVRHLNVINDVFGDAAHIIIQKSQV